MKKQGYYIVKREAGNVTAEYVSGYVVEKVCAGTVARFGVRKDDEGLWTVDDLGTGLVVNPGRKFGKRAEALEYVNGEDAQTGKSLVGAFSDYLEKHPHAYKATMRALEATAVRKEPWPLKERQEFIDERTREFAGKAEQMAKDKAGVDVAVTVTENADVTAVAIEPKKAPKKQKAPAAKKAEAPKAPEPPKEKVEQAIEVSLDTMREWCGERGNMVATQKREGCPIWVEGETRPHREELRGMGFRWAPKRKGWYYRVA